MSPLGEQRRLGRNDSRDKRSESRRRLPFVRIQSGTDELVVHSYKLDYCEYSFVYRGARSNGGEKEDGRTAATPGGNASFDCCCNIRSLNKLFAKISCMRISVTLLLVVGNNNTHFGFFLFPPVSTLASLAIFLSSVFY